MTLKENLNNIKRELEPRDPGQILEEGLNIKLGRTERNYEDAVKRNCMYILSRNNYKAMMAIDRYNKWKEKNQDEEESNYGFIEII